MHIMYSSNGNNIFKKWHICDNMIGNTNKIKARHSLREKIYTLLSDERLEFIVHKVLLKVNKDSNTEWMIGTDTH